MCIKYEEKVQTGIDQLKGLSHNRRLAFLGTPRIQKQQIGVLAQLVEQRTFNPFVVGSIPAHPTNLKPSLTTGLFLFMVSRGANIAVNFVVA